MDNKNIISVYINELLALAQERNTEQGVRVYNGVLEKINEIDSQAELDELIVKFKNFLSSVEAHGYFTIEEYKIVDAIRELRSSDCRHH